MESNLHKLIVPATLTLGRAHRNQASIASGSGKRQAVVLVTTEKSVAISFHCIIRSTIHDIGCTIVPLTIGLFGQRVSPSRNSLSVSDSKILSTCSIYRHFSKISHINRDIDYHLVYLLGQVL